jgi:hypothetical protein
LSGKDYIRNKGEKMKRLFLLMSFLLIPILSFAHSGRLDGNGGHRVNKDWIYDGRWLEIKNNYPELKDGVIKFKKGDYHYHCKPSLNKLNSSLHRDGIYIPSNKKEIGNYLTKTTEESVIAKDDTLIYHKLNCNDIKNVDEKNLTIFEDKEDAERNGYKPHKDCEADIVGGNI